MHRARAEPGSGSPVPTTCRAVGQGTPVAWRATGHFNLPSVSAVDSSPGRRALTTAFQFFKKLEIAGCHQGHGGTDRMSTDVPGFSRWKVKLSTTASTVGIHHEKNRSSL